jgi:hypothetical protein
LSQLGDDAIGQRGVTVGLMTGGVVGDLDQHRQFGAVGSEQTVGRDS